MLNGRRLEHFFGVAITEGYTLERLLKYINELNTSNPDNRVIFNDVYNMYLNKLQFYYFKFQEQQKNILHKSNLKTNRSIIFLQLMHNHQSPKKLINADNIYPKRLGTYQNGNALVLEYYNLDLDKFKKHVIPLDHTKDVKQNINSILKNQKHALLLRKVDAKYLEAAIKGENSNYNRNRILQNEHLNSFNEKQASYYNSNSNILSSNISSNNSHINSHTHQSSSSSQPNASTIITSKNHLSQSNQSQNQTSQQQSEISIIQASKSKQQNNKVKEQIQQIQEYYQEEFEEFEISQSLGKTNKNNINKDENKKIQNQNYNSSISQVTQPLTSKYQQKQAETQQPKKKKDKTKKSKKKQSIVEDQFQFDFLDDGDKPKSNSKSKQKSKQKSVSKQKKQKKQKKQQKQVKPPKQNTKKPIIVQSIQDQFQFL